jgi:voltage-gated potassium channel
MRRERFPESTPRWRRRLHEVIFEADTPAGKGFDVLLLIAISISILVVILESVPSLHNQYWPTFLAIEWFFTILFTVEYILRLISVRRPRRYVVSFYGLVDLVAILPTYLSLLLPGGQYLMVVRVLRLLRVFRIFKLGEFLKEANLLTRALYYSRRKISVFMMAVFALVVVVGTMMYVIEGAENGFVDIPTSIYWAVVTLTTVGYGDIAPQTALGKGLASFVMLLGYSIIAVPTGIVTAELARAASETSFTTQACPNCGRDGHAFDALYCKYCSALLNEPSTTPPPAVRGAPVSASRRKARQ